MRRPVASLIDPTVPPRSVVRVIRALFLTGCLTFALVRLCLVLVPPTVLQIPRLGDDALVYLWKGAMVGSGYAIEAPALRDVLEQANLDDGPPSGVRRARATVLGRVVGTYGPLYDLLSFAGLSTGLPQRWAFALTEVVGVMLMTAGIASILRVAVGGPAAGVGLMLLAVATLPGQGIYSFIPSTLALSLALLIWAILLREGAQVRLWPVVILAGVMLGVHPIGQLYVLMGILLHLLVAWGGWGRTPWRIVGLYGSLVCLVAVAVWVPTLGRSPELLRAGERGAVDLGAGLAANLEAVWSLAKDPLLRKNPLLAVLFAAGISVGWRSGLPPPARSTMLVIGIALVGSLLHALPGYPAELFYRLMVPGVILAAGVAGRFLVSRLERPRGPLLLGIVALAWVGTGIVWGNELFHWMNQRIEVVHDARVRAEILRLSAGTTLLYGDAVIALPVALLAGADRHGALVGSMLAGTPSLTRLVEARQPSVAVVPVPRSLNSLARLRDKSLVPRRIGLYLPAVDLVVLRPSPDHGPIPLHLFWVNPGSAFAISVMAVRGQGAPALETRLTIPAQFSGWVPAWHEPMADLQEVRLSLPRVPAWIEGIAAASPSPRIRWPWGSGLQLWYHGRGKPAGKAVEVQFSVASLLAEYRADDLRPFIRPVGPIVSDESGLVFLRTRF